VVVGDGFLDRRGDGIDLLGEGVDGLQGAVFAPAGHVGNALALDVEADLPAHHVGDGVDEHLGLLTGEVLVVQLAGGMGVREFVK
jgi:hypothetical protein